MRRTLPLGLVAFAVTAAPSVCPASLVTSTLITTSWDWIIVQAPVWIGCLRIEKYSLIRWIRASWEIFVRESFDLGDSSFDTTAATAVAVAVTVTVTVHMIY